MSFDYGGKIWPPFVLGFEARNELVRHRVFAARGPERRALGWKLERRWRRGASGFQIVCTDNFGRDYNGGRSETVVATGLGETEAKARADAMNDDPNKADDDFFVVHSETYKPYVFEGY